MKHLWSLSLLLAFCFSVSGQNFDNLNFGTDATFEVATWNIEWFPKNEQVTIGLVQEIIEALDIDVLAIQEIDDTNAFHQMVDNLEGYEGYLESSWFAGLAYIYKADVIQINDIYEIYTSSPYWNAFPRSPMIMDLNFYGKRIIVINNHFKCCGDGIFDMNNEDDQETRRYDAINLIDDYIDEHFQGVNTIILGDLNDILTDNESNNIFQNLLDDEEHYLFTDLEIANGSNDDWSYPNWPSHLDHIIITKELFDEFGHNQSTISTVRIDDYMESWWDYDGNVSDHRPVALKLKFDVEIDVDEIQHSNTFISNFPNPFSSKTKFSFSSVKDNSMIEIFNIYGQLIFQKNIEKGQSSLSWNPGDQVDGVYFVKLTSLGQELASTKVIVRN